MTIPQLSLVENAVDILVKVAMLSEERKSKILAIASCHWLITLFPSNEFSAYEKYARWQARTVDPFIDYFTVLDIGIRWEKRSYGNKSFGECVYALIFGLDYLYFLDFRKNIEKKSYTIQTCEIQSPTLRPTTQD